jgi:hypothetical protein
MLVGLTDHFSMTQNQLAKACDSKKLVGMGGSHLVSGSKLLEAEI